MFTSPSTFLANESYTLGCWKHRLGKLINMQIPGPHTQLRSASLGLGLGPRIFILSNHLPPQVTVIKVSSPPFWETLIPEFSLPWPLLPGHIFNPLCMEQEPCDTLCPGAGTTEVHDFQPWLYNLVHHPDTPVGVGCGGPKGSLGRGGCIAATCSPWMIKWSRVTSLYPKTHNEPSHEWERGRGARKPTLL